MLFYRGVRRLFRIVAVPMFRFRVEGAERIPQHGAAIVVAPHRSWLDPACVGAACSRPIRFIMIDRFYHKPLVHRFFRAMQTIPVTPGGAESIGALRAAIRELRRGELVGIFPEGRVMPEGELGRIHPGAALLAARVGVPVVPMVIFGSARAWPHGRWWPGPARVRVVVGDPIEPPTDRDRQAVDAFASTIRGRLEALCRSAGSA